MGFNGGRRIPHLIKLLEFKSLKFNLYRDKAFLGLK